MPNKGLEERYIGMEESLEEQIELNQKFLNFLTFRGLVADFREWESKTRGIAGWFNT